MEKYSAIGKLEILISKLWNILEPVAFIREDAEDAELKVEDYFLKTILDNIHHSANGESSIADRLRDVIDSEFGEISFPPLPISKPPKRIDPGMRSEVYDTITGLDEVNRRIYVNRIKEVANGASDLNLAIAYAASCLNDFYVKLPSLRDKMSAEKIIELEKLAKNPSELHYIQSLPKVLHIAFDILFLIPVVLAYLSPRINILDSFIREVDESLNSNKKETDKAEKIASSNKNKSQPVRFNSFRDVFKNPDNLDKCVNTLRQIDPPLINANGTWIGRRKSKGKFAAWIERLETCEIIYFIPDKKQLVPLVNDYFPNLKFGAGARTFATPNQDALDDFTALILQV